MRATHVARKSKPTLFCEQTQTDQISLKTKSTVNGNFPTYAAQETAFMKAQGKRHRPTSNQPWAVWTLFLLLIADLQHHFGILGPKTRAFVLGRVQHITGSGLVGVFPRLAPLSPADRAHFTVPRTRARRNPLLARRSNSCSISLQPGARPVRYVPAPRLPGLQAGWPAMVDGLLTLTNGERVAFRSPQCSTCKVFLQASCRRY